MSDDPARAASPMILCENLDRIYKVADLEVVALQGLDLAVERGEVMAIIGNSGSGNSSTTAAAAAEAAAAPATAAGSISAAAPAAQTAAPT